MQYACAIFSHVVCPAQQDFFTLSQKRHDFRKQKLVAIKCFFFKFSLQYLHEIFLILIRNERDMIKNVYWSSINPFNAKLNPIFHLLALLGARHILHVSRTRVLF